MRIRLFSRSVSQNLASDHGHQGGMRHLVTRNGPPGKAQVGNLYGDAQAILDATVGPQECQIALTEAVKPDQLGPVAREGQQLFALCRVQ